MSSVDYIIFDGKPIFCIKCDRTYSISYTEVKFTFFELNDFGVDVLNTGKLDLIVFNYKNKYILFQNLYLKKYEHSNSHQFTYNFTSYKDITRKVKIKELLN